MSAESLKDLYERLRRAMTRRPRFAKRAALARVDLEDGFTCQVEEAGWRTRVDQLADEVGAGSAPQAAHLMRASLVAALAIGYRLWSARLGIPIGRVTVELMCEEDVRGELGIADGVSVGWQRIVVDVVIVSRAEEGDVRRVVETADRLCPMLSNLSSGIERVHRLRVLAPPAR